MAAELIVTAEAEQDLAEAYAWYEARRFGLGEELLTSVDACMNISTYAIATSYQRCREF